MLHSPRHLRQALVDRWKAGWTTFGDITEDGGCQMCARGSQSASPAGHHHAGFVSLLEFLFNPAQLLRLAAWCEADRFQLGIIEGSLKG